jgi:hypothetical protein
LAAEEWVNNAAPGILTVAMLAALALELLWWWLRRGDSKDASGSRDEAHATKRGRSV